MLTAATFFEKSHSCPSRLLKKPRASSSFAGFKMDIVSRWGLPMQKPLALTLQKTYKKQRSSWKGIYEPFHPLLTRKNKGGNHNLQISAFSYFLFVFPKRQLLVKEHLSLSAITCSPHRLACANLREDSSSRFLLSVRLANKNA